MTFKVDENMPRETLELLRAAGYEAATVAEEGLAGADDAVLAEVLKTEGRALITLDLEFSDIRSYPPQAYHGILVIRSKRQDRVHHTESGSTLHRSAAHGTTCGPPLDC